MTKEAPQQEQEALEQDTIQGLERTVGSMAARIQQKIAEKKVQKEELSVHAKERHARIMQGLTTIRKAMQETCKITLGERFYLDLDIGDSQGWPQLSLHLVDRDAPHRRDYELVVCAHDRRGNGTIEFRDQDGKLLGSIPAKEEEGLKKLPSQLKGMVRAFLTKVADYVVQPLSRQDIVLEEPSGALSDEHAGLKDENLFIDDLYEGLSPTKRSKKKEDDAFEF